MIRIIAVCMCITRPGFATYARMLLDTAYRTRVRAASFDELKKDSAYESWKIEVKSIFMPQAGKTVAKLWKQIW